MKKEKSTLETIEMNDFHILDETMGQLINESKKIMEILSKNTQNMSRESINDHTSALENMGIGIQRGITERVELYKKLKVLPEPNQTQKKKIEEIELVLGEVKDIDIEGFLNDYYTNKEGSTSEVTEIVSDEKKQEATEEVSDDSKPEVIEVDLNDQKQEEEEIKEKVQEEQENEEVSDELKSYKYTSILPQIKDFRAKIKKGVSGELKKNILSFIEEYEKRITYRQSVLDTAIVRDFGSDEYKDILKALSNLRLLKETVQKTQTPEESQENNSKKDKTEEEKKPDTTPEENAPEPYDSTESYREWGENFKKLTDEEKAVFIQSLTPRVVNSEEENKEAEKPEENEEVEEFTSYESVIDSIIDNKSSLARETFLNPDDHRSMMQDLKNQMISIVNKEGSDALNNFITKQQENIKKLIDLISTHGSVDKNLLLNALRSDSELLEESRTKIKAKVVKNKNITAPNINTDPINTADTNTPDSDNSADTNKGSEHENLFSKDQMDIIDLYPELKVKLFKAVEDYNRIYKIDPNSEIAKECLNDVNNLLKKIESKNKSQPKKETESTTEEWAGYGIIDINDPKQPLYISYKSIIIMKSKPGFYEKVQDTINKHNENIRNKASREVLDESMAKIEETQNEFKDIKKEWQDKIDRDLQKEKDKKKKGKKTEEAKEKEKSETTEPATEEDKTETKDAEDAEKEEVRIFNTKEGIDYHNISNDVQFNTWLEGIEKSIIKNQYSIESEIKSLDDWYEEYQDALPYIEKINKIFEESKKEKGENKIKLLALKDKIAGLIYEIHTSGKTGKDKIDYIFKQYEESVALSEKKSELKKSIDLATKIKKERKIGEKERDLSSGQVKNILESRGSVNTEKNIEDMLVFLRDMQNNYVSNYANKKEDGDNDMSKIYSRYNKKQKKKGFFSTILFSIPGTRFFAKESPVEYQNLKNLIVKLRELNLVDRKNGDEDSKNDNEARMDDLIRFTSGQIELLIEHIQNPKSNKAETLDEKQKETLKIFDTLYKTFTESKYSSKDAIKEAEDFLSSNKNLSKELESIGESADITESIFDDKYELATFEHEAKLQIAREDLLKLKSDLINFPKTGKNINLWTKMSNKFTELEKTFEELGEDMENDLDIKTTRLLLEDLTMRHINKDVYKDLSANFTKYENIINSPDRTLEEKKEYLKDLLLALKKHRANKTNTKVQNGVLDDTIKRYEKIFKAIK